jgi:hypothetical protein
MVFSFTWIDLHKDPLEWGGPCFPTLSLIQPWESMRSHEVGCEFLRTIVGDIISILEIYSELVLVVCSGLLV